MATGLFAAFWCFLAARLLEIEQPGESGLGLGMIIFAMAAPAVVVGHLFSLTIGRADPVGSIRRHRVSLTIQSLLAAGFLVLLLSRGMFTGYTFADGDFGLGVNGAGRLYLAFLLIGIGLISIRIESTIRGSDAPQRQRFRLIALGMLGVVLYFIYLLTDAALNGRIDQDVIGASLVPIAIGAGLIGWGQLRGGLDEAGVTIGRQVVFRSFTVLLVVGYLLLVLLFGKLAEILGFRPGYIAGATIIIASATSVAAFLLSRTFRTRIRRSVERNIYSNRLDYRTWWLRASHELVSGVGVSELLIRTHQILEDLFQTKPVTIYLARRAGDPYLAMNPPLAIEPPEIDPGEPLIDLLSAAPEPIVLPERRDRSVDPELLPILVESEGFVAMTDARILAPLKTSERLIGFVVLGPRERGENYSYEERALLETVTLQLAGAIRGAWLSEDLAAAREMEVFSQWAGVVVHDLKNFVSPLKLFTQNARRHLHNPEFREQAIDDIQHVVDRMEGAIHRLTALRHGEEMALSPTDVEWVLDSVVSRSGLATMTGITVQRSFAGVPTVMADPSLLDRVLTNLVTNALEAMPDGGVLTLETEDLRDSGPVGRWAVVRVRDTGVGMTPAFLRHRLFQPFATTKKKGWGLGLYQCRSIVEAHGGFLQAQSQPGLGTEFRLMLPLRASATRSGRDIHAAPSRSGFRPQ